MRDEFHEAQFSPSSDDALVICPYCKHSYQPEPADYSEDTRAEECSECGKKFHLHQDFSVSHVVKPDCELNGEQHRWDFVDNKRRDYMSCDVCDKWRRTADAPAQGKTGSEAK